MAVWIAMLVAYYRQPGLLFDPASVQKFLLPPLRLSVPWLMDIMKPAALFIWLLFVGIAIGVLAIQRCGVPVRGRTELFCLSLGLGWGVLGSGMSVLGLLGLWFPKWIFGGLVCVTLPLGYALVNSGIWKGQSSDEPWSAWAIGLMVVLGIFVLVNLAGAMMPEIFYDALAYHLALPELYWLKHGFVPTGYNIYSGIPMLTEMLYALALPLGGDRAAHLINWTFGVSSALMAYVLCRRIGSRSAGLLAAVLFYSSPLVGTLSCKSSVELAWAFFLAAAVHTFLSGFDARTKSRASWLLPGIFAGFALSTKYLAWPLLPALLILLAIRARPREAWEAGFRLSVVALLVLSPWIIRNIWLYKNPIFPFFQDAFDPNGLEVRWRGLLIAGMGRDLGATFGTWAGWLRMLFHPWWVSIQPYDVTNLGPMFLMGLPLLVLLRPGGDGYRKGLLIVTGVLWAAWCLTTEMPRFFLPIFLLLVPAYSVVLEALPGKSIVRPIFVAVIAINLLCVMSWLGTYDAPQVIWGEVSPERFLDVPHASYALPCRPAARFIRGNLPMDARVIVLGEARGYGLSRDYVAATEFNESPFSRYLKQSANADELVERVRAAGFTHVMVNYAEILARGAMWFNMTAHEKGVWQDFRHSHLRLLFGEGDIQTVYSTNVWCEVYQIL